MVKWYSIKNGYISQKMKVESEQWFNSILLIKNIEKIIPTDIGYNLYVIQAT